MNKNLRSKKKSNGIGVPGAIAILIMGSVGTGIFFKNAAVLNSNWGSMLLLILSWILSSVGIIFLAFSLFKVIKDQTKSDTGISGWISSNNSPAVTKTVRNYLVYFYLPIIRFGVVFYGVMAFINLLEWNNIEWWQLMFVVLGVIIITHFTGGIWGKVTKNSNRVFLFLQSLPIAFIIVYGIYFAATQGTGESSFLPGELKPDIALSNPLLGSSPIFGLFASVPSIYFIYDGFYKVADVRPEMKKQSLMKYVILFGMVALLLVNVILSIFLVISFNGSFTSSDSPEITKVANFLIICSALGNYNLNAIQSSRTQEQLYNEKQYTWIKKFINFKNSSIENPYNGSTLTLIITLIYFLISSLIGSFAFFNSGGYGYTSEFTTSMLSFNDILIDWSSVMIFAILLLPIGANFNKFEKKDKIIAGFAFVFILLPIGYIVFETTFNFFYMLEANYLSGTGDQRSAFISIICRIALLFFNIGIVLIPYMISESDSRKNNNSKLNLNKK